MASRADHPGPDGTIRKYPAVIDPTQGPTRSSPYLSQEERVVIADRRRTRVGMRSIARELGRDVSTVSRELGRNSDPADEYRSFVAQRAARSRMARPRLRKVAADPVLTAVVQGWLDALWSPEQISASLAAAFPNDAARRLATESIYQALYADGVVLQSDPTSCLRSGRRRRRPHRRADRRRSKGGGRAGCAAPDR